MLATTIAALVALAAPAMAQLYPNQTGSFHLKLTNTNSDLDNTYLYACHSGAAIEQLCLGNKTLRDDGFGTFYLNYSANSLVNDKPAGALVWNLPFTSAGGAIQTASSPLSFSYNPTSNVAILILSPSSTDTSDVVPAGFDDDEHLFAYSYVDESVFPPDTSSGPHLFYHFALCQTYFGGYRYTALAWVTAGQPLNPSCHAVTVTREFPILAQ